MHTEVLTGHVASVEQVDVDVFESHVSIVRFGTSDAKTGSYYTGNSVLRITLKDGSVWVLDVAGAQFGQRKSVMPFADYSRHYIAEIAEVHPFGKVESHIAIFDRHRQNASLITQLDDNWTYQIDELAEWEYHNITVHDLLKAKTSDFQRLKQELIDYIATAAREYSKLALHDPTSTAKPIDVNDIGYGNASNMSEEDKGRMERKMARKLAEMEPAKRAMFEKQVAEGSHFMMV